MRFTGNFYFIAKVAWEMRQRCYLFVEFPG